MKKIYSLLTLLSIILIVGCESPIINPDLIPDFIDEVLESEIYKDTELPKRYLDYGLRFYVGEEELTDYILKVPFMLEDQLIEVYMGVHTNFSSKLFMKQVLLKASKPVNDLYITTKNNQAVTSKDVYLDGELKVDHSDNFNLPLSKMYIKGRGNSSWDYPKKPYRIKFEEKTSILGMAAARDYVLLSEFGDKSLLRNYMGHMMSSYLNIEHALETRFVHLYLNNQYLGMYLLTEQVEFDDNRLNVDTSEGKNGFLLEMDVYERLDQGDEVNIDYIELKNRPFAIKEPNMRDFEGSVATTKVNFIKSYMTLVFNNLKTSSYDSFIDKASFMDYFIIQEITKNVDINFSSVYMYKREGEKLKMGPLWDFDISMGNGDYYEYQPQGYWAIHNIMLADLLQNPSFKLDYKVRFLEVIQTYEQIWKDELTKMFLLINQDANQNFERWDILETYYWPNTPGMMEANTHQKQYEYLMSWLNQRFAWLKNNISNF
ncbi:CotH kinase family protein [Acholeplasma equirhinis]|uniref:CotH kinase family protein n=1 Tax=Acholeplasma equirhinis TaxID=555393 RepID=UPI00197A79FD|nr:CotH kinase family protein [Acholeplasma equirhinis]MBN3491160.1 CotH kinase family protein [Acholeplasma equirhinis]